MSDSPKPSPQESCTLHSKPLSKFYLTGTVTTGMVGNFIRDGEGAALVRLHADGTVCLPEPA